MVSVSRNISTRTAISDDIAAADIFITSGINFVINTIVSNCMGALACGDRLDNLCGS